MLKSPFATTDVLQLIVEGLENRLQKIGDQIEEVRAFVDRMEPVAAAPETKPAPVVKPKRKFSPQALASLRKRAAEARKVLARKRAEAAKLARQKARKTIPKKGTIAA